MCLFVTGTRKLVVDLAESTAAGVQTSFEEWIDGRGRAVIRPTELTVMNDYVAVADLFL
jgi:hypothetical protein